MTQQWSSAGFQLTARQWLFAFFWRDIILFGVFPWLERGHNDGHIYCLGPLRFGWREAQP